MLTEQRFRGLDAPEKLEFVYFGIDLNEIKETKRKEVLAVASPFTHLLTGPPVSPNSMLKIISKRALFWQ